MATRHSQRATVTRNRDSPRHARVNAQEPRGSTLFRKTLVEASLIVVCVLIFQLTLRTFAVQLYSVPSVSMENTLKVGDVLVVSKLSPRFTALNRGDIVVFRDPGGWLSPESRRKKTLASAANSVLVFVGLVPKDSGEHLVKRVIGFAGDVVACDAEGALTVNKILVDEPYLFPGDPACSSPFQVTVTAGSIWVMGDHRSRSADSRYHLKRNDGGVPVASVIGRVVAVSNKGKFSWL
ncbi:signal peptidase I [Frankia sp. Cr1]|uniref:signal peptidase I n=1 Tax=Frankia sp. Cr1 TaxID=3073931 RepID=UPI002AD2B53B|nr:signal peptidase I [Frankia sp. Cr1]